MSLKYMGEVLLEVVRLSIGVGGNPRGRPVKGWKKVKTVIDITIGIELRLFHDGQDVPNVISSLRLQVCYDISKMLDFIYF